MGRFFHASDEKGQGQGSGPYVVLSYAYWHGHFHDDPGVLGRPVLINKHQLTIIGVAPPVSGYGTVLFAVGDVDSDDAAARHLRLQPNAVSRKSWRRVGRTSEAGSDRCPGHAGPEYPGGMAVESLSRRRRWHNLQSGSPRIDRRHAWRSGPCVHGWVNAARGLDSAGRLRHLGSLFAARTADRAKETALRLALGSKRGLIVRQMLDRGRPHFRVEGALGMAGGEAISHVLSAWQPMPDIPINVPVNPDAWTYVVALLLAVASGLLFGMVPVRQVMRADPWQVIRTWCRRGGRPETIRAARFCPAGGADCYLCRAGYIFAGGMAWTDTFRGRLWLLAADRDAGGSRHAYWRLHGRPDSPNAAPLAGCGERHSRCNIGWLCGPSSAGRRWWRRVRLCRQHRRFPADQRGVADAMNYNISPGYPAAAGTTLLAGRDLTFKPTTRRRRMSHW